MVPCIFGVLTVLNKPQAIAHSTGPGNEGLSWGRGAVEMGLHRMAALGMDKKPTQQQGADGLNPFVTFRAPLPAVGPAGGGGGDGKNVTTKPVERRVGF